MDPEDAAKGAFDAAPAAAPALGQSALMGPLGIASTALDALGHLFGGIMGANAGSAQNKAQQYAAQQARQEAGVAAQEAILQGNTAAGHAAVQTAANGGGFVGSSMGVISQLSREAMFNARAAAYRGVTQSQSDLYQGAVAKANGVNSLIGGAVGAAGAAASGAATEVFRGQQLSSLASLQGLGQASPYDYAGVQ